MSCYYVTWAGQALGATHFLPFIITGFTKVVSFFYHEPLFFFYGLFWFAMQGVLWLAQHYFQIVRPDPFCSIYHTYAYPSSEIYYIFAAVTAIMTWTMYFKVQQSIQVWVIVYLVVFIPAGLLWFFQMNRWWEILWTALLSIVSNVIFTLFQFDHVGRGLL